MYLEYGARRNYDTIQDLYACSHKNGGYKPLSDRLRKLKQIKKLFNKAEMLEKEEYKMNRIDENFDLQAYVTKGVENVVADALKATFKDPRETAFMLKFAAASKAASKSAARPRTRASISRPS